MKKAILMSMLALAPLAAQEEIKVIHVKYRPADSLARVVSMGIPVDFSREFNTITLRGPAEKVKIAEAIIQQYDTPRRQAEFVVRVIEAGSAPKETNDAAGLVPAELKSLLRYNRYAQRDLAILRGMEADELTIELAGNLTGRMRFNLREAEPAPQIELRFHILGATRVFKGPQGADVTDRPTLLETSTTLIGGETVVLGASKMQGGSSALIVLLTGKLLP